MDPTRAISPRRTKGLRGSDGPAPHSFDITCVVGTVVLGDGDDHPHVAAMRIITEHGAAGTYEFPGELGQVTIIIEDATIG